MDIKKLIIGTIAGGVVFFLLGWLIYGILLQNYMAHNTGEIGPRLERKEMNFLFLIAGNLLQGLLLAYILIKSNQTTLTGGLVTGAIVGFLMAASVDAIMYATTYALSKRGMLADTLAFAVLSAIAGGIIAAVTGRVKTV